LWLLPNLTEDVGFFASFWPLYKYEYKGNEDEPKKKKSDSDSKKSDDTQPLAENEVDLAGEGKNSENSETESEGSQKSQTGKDFEIVDRDELES
jgi:translocation protein SEC62